MLFAGELWKGKIELEPKFRDYELKYARRNGEHFTSSAEFIRYMGKQLFEATVLGKTLVNLFAPEAQAWAFGVPGTAGDPERIEHLARRTLSIYDDSLDWVANIRGTLVPPECEDLRELAAQMMSVPIAQSREFIDSAVLQIGQIPEQVARGESVVIELVFELSIDDEISSALTREQNRLAGQVEEAEPRPFWRRPRGRQ